MVTQPRVYYRGAVAMISIDFLSFGLENGLNQQLSIDRYDRNQTEAVLSRAIMIFASLFSWFGVSPAELVSYTHA
jgi:hypothetical protein